MMMGGFCALSLAALVVATILLAALLRRKGAGAGEVAGAGAPPFGGWMPGACGYDPMRDLRGGAAARADAEPDPPPTDFGDASLAERALIIAAAIAPRRRGCRPGAAGLPKKEACCA